MQWTSGYIAAEGQARSGGHFPEQSQRAGGSSGAHCSWDWHHAHGRQQVCMYSHTGTNPPVYVFIFVATSVVEV